MAEYQYQIRRAEVGDANGLGELAKGGFRGYPFTGVYEPPSLAKAIAGGEHRIVALLRSDLQRIIGTAVLGIDGLMVEVKRVIVDPAYRQNGLAEAMTKQLANDARELHTHPYSDTRADQIGMQKASLRAGLNAVSVETGKHVVFYHEDSLKQPLGPARESMIHMTSLRANTESLYSSLKKWSPHLKKILIKNMKRAYHEPKEKSKKISHKHLPSAQKVREQIHQRLDDNKEGFKVLHDEQDVTIIQRGNTKMAIVKPDASGFIETSSDTTRDELDYILTLSESIGLQIVTSYENIDDLGKVSLMDTCGLIPAMMRPWQTKKDGDPEWQVGFRKTMNKYDDCLHHIRIDHKVKQQLEDFTIGLEKNVL